MSLSCPALLINEMGWGLERLEQRGTRSILRLDRSGFARSCRLLDVFLDHRGRGRARGRGACEVWGKGRNRRSRSLLRSAGLCGGEGGRSAFESGIAARPAEFITVSTSIGSWSSSGSEEAVDDDDVCDGSLGLV